MSKRKKELARLKAKEIELLHKRSALENKLKLARTRLTK